jgi:hypothetical protein
MTGAPFVDGTGLGTPIGQTYDELAAALPAGTTIQAEGDGYPAVPVPDALASLGSLYQVSMDDGVDDAVADLNAEHQACPSSTMVIAGYSQGADVIRRAINPNVAYPLNSSTAYPRLDFTPAVGKSFLLLFGDADFHSEPVPIVTGGGSESNTGILWDAAALGLLPPVPNLPSTWHTVSFCHDDDIVCQFSLGSDITQHIDYGSESDGLNDGFAAAWRIMQYLGISSPTVPVATAYMGGVSCVTTGRSQVNVTLTNDNTSSGNPVAFTATFYDGVGFVQTTSTETVAAGGTYQWDLPVPNVLTVSLEITTPFPETSSVPYDSSTPVTPVEDQPVSEVC